ncbi:Sugar (and other) transporter [Ceratobasidium sp. AG-Ba]|nr:Sugar (and other) transporter [Ceratobasidium sp. AG-Ba]QRW10929.1 Sugar (and other) transporter [Ceratobasidium sp. AG-Ba]
MSNSPHDKITPSPTPSISHQVTLSKLDTNDRRMSYNERRRAALREVDEAQFSRFHLKACLVAGVGFFTDAYDVFAITIAATMIGIVYGRNGVLNPSQDLGLKVATPIGTLIGQLLFGRLADVVGRKSMYGTELIIIIVGTVGQTISGQGSSFGVIVPLAIWRFIMGVGVGGDYPLSAVITSEFAATRIRGRMMTAVFAMQGFGYFAASLVALVVTESYKLQIIHGPATFDAVDDCWRLLIGLGAVPAIVTLYFRLTMPETPRFTMDIERNVRQASLNVSTFLTTGSQIVDPDAAVERVESPKASRRDFVRHFGQWKNGKILLGTAYSWFALDVAFYGLGLNTSIVLTAIGFGDSTSTNDQLKAYQTLHNVSVGNIILSACGLIPGYWVTFLFIDRWGRKPIQFMGYAVLTVIFACMGLGYDRMVYTTPDAKRAFVFLYCLANFFQNFGPNTTTFIVPGEAFPTRYRSTAHGISAASGKFGAIVAQVGFALLRKSGESSESGHFIQRVLEIFAVFMLTGFFATFLVEETNGRTLEELSNEPQEAFISNDPGPLEVLNSGASGPSRQAPSENTPLLRA